MFVLCVRMGPHGGLWTDLTVTFALVASSSCVSTLVKAIWRYMHAAPRSNSEHALPHILQHTVWSLLGSRSCLLWQPAALCPCLVCACSCWRESICSVCRSCMTNAPHCCCCHCIVYARVVSACHGLIRLLASSSDHPGHDAFCHALHVVHGVVHAHTPQTTQN